jgi:hypothetical protein
LIRWHAASVVLTRYVAGISLDRIAIGGPVDPLPLAGWRDVVTCLRCDEFAADGLARGVETLNATGDAIISANLTRLADSPGRVLSTRVLRCSHEKEKAD